MYTTFCLFDDPCVILSTSKVFCYFCSGRDGTILAPDPSQFVKPKSDIHCNRSATSPRPKFKTIAEVAEESQLGFAVGRRLIGVWLPTDRRLVGDLVGTSLRLVATGRRPVGDRSPTSRRSVADQVNLKL